MALIDTDMNQKMFFNLNYHIKKMHKNLGGTVLESKH